MPLRSCLIVALTLGLISGCGGESADDPLDGRIRVVATTGQAGDLVRHVGGEHVAVTVLMGPGIDPHQYKASAGDVERLRTADLIVSNGLHLEAKMAEVLERLGERRPTLAVAEAIPAQHLDRPDAFKGAYDPHVWFDPRLWRHALDSVTEKLTELAPGHAADFSANAAAHAAEFDALLLYGREKFATVPEQQRVLVTAHDAFHYFGQAFGLEVKGLQGISTATEAGTGDVQDLAHFIAERGIPALFVESSVSPRAIEAVIEAVRSRGAEVRVGGEIYSDALGDRDTPTGQYIGMVRHNIDTIVAALRGETTHDQ